MKSKRHDKAHNNMLISRRKPQTTAAIVLSLVGFILFLTGGLVVATAVIDGIFNSVTAITFLCVVVGIISYKLGRYIMKRSSE